MEHSRLAELSKSMSVYAVVYALLLQATAAASTNKTFDRATTLSSLACFYHSSSVCSSVGWAL